MCKGRKIIAIFSGYNQRAVIAFLRTLCVKNIEFVIIASNNEDSILRTSYKDKVFCVRKERQLVLEEIQDVIENVKKVYKCQRVLIPPSTEALNRFLLEYRSELEKIGCIIPLVDKTVYEKISDKKEFSSWCNENNILIPEEYNLENGFENALVAKPKQYFATSTGLTYSPVIIKSEQEYKDFFEKNSCEDFYYQEYISGRSLYLLYYFYNDGDLLKYSQENIAQQPGGKSMVAALKSDIHEEPISKAYEDLFASVSFRGFVMVELRQNSGKEYMIEANPRFWGPSQFFVDSGINFFEAFLYDYGMIKEKPEVKINKAARYFWSGGFDQVSMLEKEMTYYGEGRECIFKELPQWIEQDIYRRDDTKELFFNRC